MATMYCGLCKRPVEAKRNIGIGSLLLALVTAGLWLLVIPLYTKRCPICKSDALSSSQGASGEMPRQKNTNWMFVGGAVLAIGILGNFIALRRPPPQPVAAAPSVNTPSNIAVPNKAGSLSIEKQIAEKYITGISGGCPRQKIGGDIRIQSLGEWGGKKTLFLTAKEWQKLTSEIKQELRNSLNDYISGPWTIIVSERTPNAGEACSVDRMVMESTK